MVCSTLGWPAVAALTTLFATIPPSGDAPVVLQPLAADLCLHLAVAPVVPLQLHFPVACHTVHAEPDKLEVRLDPEQPQDVVLLARPHLRPGTITKVNVSCDEDVRASLTLQVETVAAAVPRVEFYRPAAAAAAVLPAMLTAAAQAFVEKPWRTSVRDGDVVLHLDRLRRLGHFILLDLRLQNRGPKEQPFLGLDVAVACGAAPCPPPHHRLTTNAPAPPQVVLQGHHSLLRPGARWALRLGFFWPAARGPCVVTLRAGDGSAARRLALPPLQVEP